MQINTQPTTLPQDDISKDFIESLCDEFQRHNQIDPSYYKKWDVKRGLRNADGTGVMAGITRIGNVRGYYMQDGEKIPDQGSSCSVTKQGSSGRMGQSFRSPQKGQAASSVGIMQCLQ